MDVVNKAEDNRTRGECQLLKTVHCHHSW